MPQMQATYCAEPSIDFAVPGVAPGAAKGGNSPLAVPGVVPGATRSATPLAVPGVAPGAAKAGNARCSRE